MGYGRAYVSATELKDSSQVLHGPFFFSMTLFLKKQGYLAPRRCFWHQGDTPFLVASCKNIYSAFCHRITHIGKTDFSSEQGIELMQSSPKSTPRNF